MHRPLFLVCILALPGSLPAQMAGLRNAPIVEMASQVDCNSPAFWRDGQIHIINSTGAPILSRGKDQFDLSETEAVQVYPPDHLPIWIESTWVDLDGTVYGWYHHEPTGICPGESLTAPQIGAVISYDGGRSFQDLGIVLSSGDAPDCNAQNGFFASGHGDFSVILDREGQYFYFLFGSYGGAVSGQGIAIARMAFEDRANPLGAVWKYYRGAWTEPGRGGRLTPIFPARVAWQQEDTDSFWGPSVHWNTHLESYVILMSRSCCRSGWPQEGVYISFSPDLSQPASWTSPERILQSAPGYYPQVLGLGPGETDTEAGEVARLYLHGRSKWEIVFRTTDPPEPDPGEPPPPYEP